MKKISVFIFICFMFLCQIGFVFADEPLSEEGELAPLNPDFLNYLEDVKNGQHRLFTVEGYPLGSIPSPVDLSHVIGVVDRRVLASYPATYDLRTKNKLTPVKNQGDCGSCWTFATFASLDSYLMPAEAWDFSEQHLNSNHSYDQPECEGGHNMMSTAYLARWAGPLLESDVPYPYSISGSSAYSPAKHVQQVIFLPKRSSFTDNDTIKYFITNYGAVKFSFWWSDYYYNKNTSSYYYMYSYGRNLSASDTSNGGSGGHAVVIVGWDNNYSKNNFNVTPPGDGAFIAKNSWGTRWGMSGYFYISYYDKSMQAFSSFNNAEPANNYTNNYQYDYLGWTRSYGYGNKTGWGANIFTTNDNKPLRAVGFYTTDKNTNYTIYIYKDCQTGRPVSGTLAATQSGSESYSGYHTVKLSSSISLNSGQKFSAVIKFVNPSYTYTIPIEMPDSSDGSSGAKANKNESFVSSNGSSWKDITSQYSNTNVCIKVFTGGYSPGGNPKISISRTKMNFGYIVGGSKSNSQSFTINNTGTGTLSWTLSGTSNWLNFTPTSGTNSGVVNVSINTSGLSAGTYTAYLSVIDPYASNSPKKLTINLTVKNSAQAKAPFGEFATPAQGSTVRSSVPVTGWVLDDIGVSSVKIYNGNTYIGDALLVEGARPDVEEAYPTYPMNYKAGWGYMLLTYFLPNGGNGTYTLRVKARDIEGHEVILGSKTINCDNAHAVKPFGAIDTPAQGGIASGSSFKNMGWVLTPPPNKIPTDGSTINVYIDGTKIGRPKYNILRTDIESLFPGYANQNGAGGTYIFKTTSYKNAVHTIQWIAKDNAGNSDGIGSRFFTVQNTSGDQGYANTSDSCQEPYLIGDPVNQEVYNHVQQISEIPSSNVKSLLFKRGYSENAKVETSIPDERSIEHITILEDERLIVFLNRESVGRENQINLETDVYGISSTTSYNGCEYAGYQIIGEHLRTLPIGSTLDATNGIFYWQPGPGFVGTYRLVFIETNRSGEKTLKNLLVNIGPKFSRK